MKLTAPIVICTALATSSVLAYDGPLRIQAIRGGQPSEQMGRMIAESVRTGKGLKDVNIPAEKIQKMKEKAESKAKSKAKTVADPVKKTGGDFRNIDDYPPCSKICTPPALEASGCNFPDDVYCMCHCPTFGTIAADCEAKQCSPEDIDQIHALGGQMCESVGGFQPKIPESCKIPPPSTSQGSTNFKEGLKERKE